MARRGDALHAHILDTAKAVFLESGYDRASMDAVAARASTSKRSLYAHFPGKDVLFLACIDRSHELFEGRLAAPAAHGDDPVRAVARYCGRLEQLLAYAPIAGFCRMGITEAARLPEAAAAIHATFLGDPTAALAEHLAALGADPALAEALVGAVVQPALVRALFGLGPLQHVMPAEDELDPARLAEVEAIVAAVLAPASADARR